MLDMKKKKKKHFLYYLSHTVVAQLGFGTGRGVENEGKNYPSGTPPSSELLYSMLMLKQFLYQCCN